MNLVEDVHEFLDKFEILTDDPPHLLEEDVLEFRADHMLEELAEFKEAHERGDLAGSADALCDLVVVAIGTALMMGVPYQACWDEVHRANMTKVRASGKDDPRSKRGHALDIVKPPGFVPPDIQRILDEQ